MPDIKSVTSMPKAVPTFAQYFIIARGRAFQRT